MKIPFLGKHLPSWKNVLLSIVAAVLLILAFPDFEYWFLAWFALVPLMWAIERQKDCITACFLLGWLFGTAFFFGTCWWLAYAPIHYASIPAPVAYLLILIVCLGAGLFPGIFALILSVLLRRFGSRAFLAAPFVWVAFEFARYWITGNNWNAIGYSQVFSWFIESSRLDAQVGGVYLVGFLLVVFNAWLTNVVLAVNGGRDASKSDEVSKNAGLHAALGWVLGAYIYPIVALVVLLTYLHDYGEELERLKIDRGPLAASLLVSAGLSMFVWFNAMMPNWSFGRFVSGDSFIVAVQPNVPMSGMSQSELLSSRERHIKLEQSAFEDNLARYLNDDLGLLDTINDDETADLFRKKFMKAPKVVILPESPMNFMYSDDREFQQFIGDFARENNVSVLFNSAEPDKGTTKYFNSAVMVGPDGKLVDQYDKIYLLPFGEAVPSFLEGIVPGFVGNFAYGREYDLFPVGDAKVGVMICFESHFGALSREYVRNGADVIIEMTNDGYLGPTPVLRQHLANAVFRAVETNRPVLRVTNVGITAYIDERGQVHDPLPPYSEGTRVWTVEKSDGSQTFYVRYGDWFAWLCLAATVGLLVFGLIKKSPTEANNIA